MNWFRSTHPARQWIGPAGPLRGRRAVLVLALCLVSAGPAAAAKLLDFSWTRPAEDTLMVRARFDAPVQRLGADHLADKQLFYLDFYGVEPPDAPAEYDPDVPFVPRIQRIDYPHMQVVRFIFYTRGAIRHHGGPAERSEHLITIRSLGGWIEAPEPTPPARDGETRKIVVIDPGHGISKGEKRSSMGARTLRRIGGRHHYEKDLVLAIAKYLRGYFERVPHVDVVMTRDGEEYVSLTRRIEIAEQARGDVFVSIHLNAAPRGRKGKARGFEVYYLSDGSKETNRQLVALENDMADAEGNILPGNGERVMYDELRAILRDLADDKFRQRQAESRAFCEAIDAEFREYGPFREHHRGVKSEAFRVLMNYHMPAVLVECGFLDHPAEAREMIKPAVQRRIAAILFNGINTFMAQRDPTFRPYRIRLEP